MDEAIVCYRKAIETDPNDVSPQFKLGNALRDRGQPEEAIAAFRKAIEIDPEYVPTYCNLGNALNRQGEREEAIACYLKAIEIDPNRELTRKGLATLYTNWSWALTTAPDISQRDPAKAVQLAMQAIEVRPSTSAKDLINLGVAQYRAGDYGVSVKTFEEADSLVKGGDRFHRMFFAMAHWQLGNQEAARQMYAQGAAWIAENQKDSPTLRRFRDEAEQLMGIAENERERLIEEHLAHPADQKSESHKP